MPDLLAEIKLRERNATPDARDRTYLLNRLECAERYVLSDILYHLAQRDGERVTMERSERARDDAFGEWHALAKGEGQ